MAADLFRVLRTLTGPAGDTLLASNPIPRDEALARFEDMAIVWRMDRVRVVREQDYRPAPLIELDRYILGCSRWVRRGGGCALPSGHDGECLPIILGER
jgi:hypothetical protein